MIGWLSALLRLFRPPPAPPAPRPRPVPVPRPATRYCRVSVWAAEGGLAPVLGGTLRFDDPAWPISHSVLEGGRLRFEIPAAAVDGWQVHITAETERQAQTFDVPLAADIDVLMPPARVLVGRLVAGGRWLILDGKRYHWRGITAFRLLEMLTTGRQGEVDDYLGFCGERRLSPRVLTMARWLFPLDPAAGLAHLPDLLARARRAGCTVEAVALADTRSFPGLDLTAHVAGVGRACAEAGNALAEVGNELLPIHETQADTLVPGELLRLAQTVPSRVPVSLGSTHGPEAESRVLATLARALPNGYATAHDLRTNEERGWKWVRHPNDLAWIADDVNIYVISDEPQKADLAPDKHLGTGAVCRLRGIGDTFHAQGGLHATIPSGAELAALEGRIRGWDAFPADWSGRYVNAGQGWPVKGFSGGLRCYSTVTGGEAYTVGLDAAAMAVEWDAGARPELVVAEGGTRIWRVTR